MKLISVTFISHSLGKTVVTEALEPRDKEMMVFGVGDF